MVELLTEHGGATADPGHTVVGTPPPMPAASASFQRRPTVAIVFAQTMVEAPNHGASRRAVRFENRACWRIWMAAPGKKTPTV